VWLFFGFAVVAGLFLDIVGLFGNWLILAAVILAYVFTGFQYFNIPVIIFLFILALAGEALESIAAGYGAKRYGGAKGAIIAALVGSIAGAILGTPLIPIPVVGTLLGACLGAFFGAAGYEMFVMEKEMGVALRTGFGAALGRIGGVFAKLFIGVVMVAVIAITLAVQFQGDDPLPVEAPAPATQPAEAESTAVRTEPIPAIGLLSRFPTG